MMVMAMMLLQRHKQQQQQQQAAGQAPSSSRLATLLNFVADSVVGQSKLRLISITLCLSALFAAISFVVFNYTQASQVCYSLAMYDNRTSENFLIAAIQICEQVAILHVSLSSMMPATVRNYSLQKLFKPKQGPIVVSSTNHSEEGLPEGVAGNHANFHKVTLEDTPSAAGTICACPKQTTNGRVDLSMLGK